MRKALLEVFMLGVDAKFYPPAWSWQGFRSTDTQQQQPGEMKLSFTVASVSIEFTEGGDQQGEQGQA